MNSPIFQAIGNARRKPLKGLMMLPLPRTILCRRNRKRSGQEAWLIVIQTWILSHPKGRSWRKVKRMVKAPVLTKKVLLSGSEPRRRDPNDCKTRPKSNILPLNQNSTTFAAGETASRNPQYDPHPLSNHSLLTNLVKGSELMFTGL